MIRLVKKHLWIIPTIVFALIIVRGATLHALWGDEAETAIYARTINVRGLPYAFDGVNITSLAGATALNAQLINHVNPWLPFYLTAWSFRFFGESSFTARLPFLIFSVATIPLIYFLTLELTKRRNTALFATCVAVTSVPFILFSYNARYYSLIIFFGLSMIYTSLQFTKRTVWPKIFFVLSCVGFLYSQYVSATLLFAAIFIGLLLNLLYLKKSGKEIIKICVLYAASGAVSLVFFLPWFLMYRPYLSPHGAILSAPVDVIRLLPYWLLIAVRFYNAYNIFPYIFFPAVIGILVMKLFRRKDCSGLVYISVTIVSYLLLLAGLSAYITTGTTYFTEIRYNLILLPLFYVLVAGVFTSLWRWNRVIAISAAAVYLTTNLFTFTPFRSLPLQYLGEWLRPYTASNEIVAAYLGEHATNGDTAFVNSDRAHEPLIFLLGTKLKFVNRLSPDNTAVFPANYGKLPKYTYVFLEEPDWVILYSTHKINLGIYDFDLRDAYPMGLFPTVNLSRDYTLTILPVFYGPDETRPELESHQFTSVEPAYDEQIFIYHKIK